MTRALLMMPGMLYIFTTWMKYMKRHMRMGPIPQYINCMGTLWQNRVPRRTTLNMWPTKNILVLK